MIIVDIDRIKAIRHKLSYHEKKEVLNDVKKMLEIKQALQWRSDAMAPCCGSLNSINACLNNEVTVLENVITSLEEDNISEADRLLQEYQHILEANPGHTPPESCC